MRYGIDYFMKFFSKKKKETWANGELNTGEGQYCALGHMKFKTESDADYNVRGKALAKMVAGYIEKKYKVTMSDEDKIPSVLIPSINDGETHFSTKCAKTGSPIYLNFVKMYGKDPYTRITKLMSRIKKDCTRRSQEKQKTV